MARFYGPVGFVSSVETAPGVFKDLATERNCGGDVLRNSKKLDGGEDLNSNLSLNNSFSILANAYARENFFAIRYIKWMGSFWNVTSVEVQGPRLILTIGGVYNGPKA